MTSRVDPDQIPNSPNLIFESALWQAGCGQVAGLDEAGRGAWAGPVAAAAVILPQNPALEQKLAGVRDSKQLSAQQRSALAPLIKESALGWAVGYADAAEIDRYGILSCTRLAMQRALLGLAQKPAHLLIDALFLPENTLPQTSLLKGDQRSLSIAAASILAKTSRDAWMWACDPLYPQYAFGRHKGYGTALHQQMLARFGPCEIHRQSFEPIRQMINIQK